MARPAVACILAALLWSMADGQGALQCCGQWVCELRDPHMTRTCYSRAVLKDSLKEVVNPRTREPHIITKANGQLGTWGAMIYPAIDLSHLRARTLEKAGMAATEIDKLRPFLYPDVVGRKAKELVDSLTIADHRLTDEGYLQLQTIIFKMKEDAVEANYNTVINKNHGGTCFVNVTYAQKSVLMALLWPVRSLSPSHPGLTLAANKLWDGVVNMFTTSGDGLFYTNTAAASALQDDEQLVDCPYQENPRPGQVTPAL